jgi:hypothetical protein
MLLRERVAVWPMATLRRFAWNVGTVEKLKRYSLYKGGDFVDPERGRLHRERQPDDWRGVVRDPPAG